MIITIDGPVATGKSSIARLLAKQIGYIYFDTGAMYRALAYAVLKEQVALEDEAALRNLLDHFHFDIRFYQGEPRYLIGNEDVTKDIRLPEITAIVSEVSAIPFVRERLIGIQHERAKGVNAVVEGRDMGTTIFPKADVKIFLTGRPEVRAKRRYDELRAKFPEKVKDLTLDEMLAQINKRDEYDSKRASSPLRKAEDAYVIDTSDLTIDEIVLKILEYRDSLKTKHKS